MKPTALPKMPLMVSQIPASLVVSQSQASRMKSGMMPLSVSPTQATALPNISLMDSQMVLMTPLNPYQTRAAPSAIRLQSPVNRPTMTPIAPQKIFLMAFQTASILVTNHSQAETSQSGMSERR